jgi:hypothetical protein
VKPNKSADVKRVVPQLKPIVHEKISEKNVVQAVDENLKRKPTIVQKKTSTESKVMADLQKIDQENQANGSNKKRVITISKVAK